jgi:hypothetical protein
MRTLFSIIFCPSCASQKSADDDHLCDHITGEAVERAGNIGSDRTCDRQTRCREPSNQPAARFPSLGKRVRDGVVETGIRVNAISAIAFVRS